MTETTGKEHIVIDNGTFKMRAGFAGEDHPRAVFETVVNRSFSVAGEDWNKNARRIYPIEDGVIKHWNEIEALWKYFFEKQREDDRNHV